jgi:hypothetical protein
MNPGYTWVREEPMRRFELLASGLQNRCSTTELHRLVQNKDAQKFSVILF